MAVEEQSPRPTKKPFVQSTLTAAFYAPARRTSNSKQAMITRTPFIPPDMEANHTERSQQDTVSTPSSTKIDLHPERRANRPSNPQPFLQRATSSTLSTSTKSSVVLARTCKETLSVLPGLISALPGLPLRMSRIHSYPDTLHPLSEYPHLHPNLPPVRITVVNADTFDTALSFFSPVPTTTSPSQSSQSQYQPQSPSRNTAKPVLVLNMANANVPGGGWLKGALAQEESLCYRSSLSLTLQRKHYPLSNNECIYSPAVTIFRSNLNQGHTLHPDLTSAPERLPVVSVVSIAALRDPAISTSSETGEERYRFLRDRALMRRKMRACLRVAGREKHRRLVLGALGCGAFGNPRGEVVSCWKEVLAEEEFAGWWEGIVFAVLEDGGTRDGDGNYGVFWRGLDGVLV
ncbi:hypothetical protein MMC25_006670 [Agyrium rufum]|nr:hypothetical protein [Agyrium rufum]